VSSSTKNHYLEGLDDYMANIERRAREEEDPHQRRILWNYLHHAALEFTDQWENIFTSDMTVDHPVYRVRLATEDTVVFDGLEECKAFYSGLNEEVVILHDEKLFTNDWGMATYSTLIRFPTGATLAEEQGKSFHGDFEIDDLEATYVATCPVCSFWPFTDDARLIGEHVYQLEAFEVTAADPDEVVTMEDRATVIEKYLPGTTTPDPGTELPYSIEAVAVER
jgi:hypothetical protein